MKNNNPENTQNGKYITKTIPSAIPIWISALIWLLFSLFLPFYKISVLLITAAVSILAGIITSKILPKKTEKVLIPFSSGDEKLDSAVKQLDEATDILTRHAENLKNDCPETSRLLNETCATLTFIRSELIKDKENLKKLRRFFDYYLPTEIKLADKYAEMQATKKQGEFSMNTFLTAEKALGNINTAFKKQYDALFEDDSLDMETDITVLQTMLKQDNLT